MLTANATPRARRFGEDKVAVFESMRATFGEPDLSPFGHRCWRRVVDGT